MVIQENFKPYSKSKLFYLLVLMYPHFNKFTSRDYKTVKKY